MCGALKHTALELKKLSCWNSTSVALKQPHVHGVRRMHTDDLHTMKQSTDRLATTSRVGGPSEVTRPWRTGQRHPRPPISITSLAANGSRVWLEAEGASSIVSCSAPSKSAGCTGVPRASLRRWSRARAPCSVDHTAASVRCVGPYSRPTRPNDLYASSASME